MKAEAGARLTWIGCFNMKTSTLLFAILIFLTPATHSESQTLSANWLVVMSAKSGVQSLTQRQVMGLFLGRSKYLDGDKVTPLDHPLESELRARFYQALTGKNISDIDAYWARLRYSGRATPPLPVESSEQIIQLLSTETGIIAYLPATYLESLAEKGITPVLTM